ncbi:MAG: hypothetical protein ABIK09_10425 [Pseudomonadota bacterium]
MQDRRLIALLVALALAVFGGCGDEEVTGKTPEEAMGFKPNAPSAPTKGGAKKKRAKGGKGAQPFKANASWDRVAPHFLSFATRMDDEIHNPALTWKYRDAFQDNLDKLFPPEKPKAVALTGTKTKKLGGAQTKAAKKDSGVKSILDALKKAGTQPIELTEAKTVEAAPVDPLLIHPLASYRFLIILSGTSNPEVQVEAPGGHLLVLHVNDRIGKEGGYVQDILKQEILIKLPEKIDPEIVSLMPPLLPSEFGTP